MLTQSDLAAKVDAFCESEPEVMSWLGEVGARSVFFGGVIRSLVFDHPPRDLDVVVLGVDKKYLATKYEKHIVRINRFGGLHLRYANWDVDMWPLNATWAFREDSTAPLFSALPGTAALNINAVAVDLQPIWGRREVFAGAAFFDGYSSRTLDIQRWKNPCPALVLIRAIGVLEKCDMQPGPQLARYARTFGRSTSAQRYEALQRTHYGYVTMSGRDMVSRIEEVGGVDTN